MGDAHYGNAMTEVALALSMAFFSIMILAMVSMSAVHAEKPEREVSSEKAIAAKLASASSDTTDHAVARLSSDDTLVIYHKGQFYNHEAAPLDPASLNRAQRIILALSPKTAMSEALQARARIATENLVVSMLNAEWLAVLDRIEDSEK